MRAFFSCTTATLAKGLDRLSSGRLTPNVITAVGLILHLPIAWIIAQGNLVHGGILLVLVGCLDAIDGCLARLQGRQTAFGAWFDATSDRLKESLVFSALAYYLAESGGEAYLIALCAAALGLSICISYFKAKAEAVLLASRRKRHQDIGQALSVGLLSYEWRVLVLAASLIGQQLTVGLAVLVAGGLITLIQRGFAFRKLLAAEKS